MPEEVEPLHPERDGIEVTLRREMAFGEEAAKLWSSHGKVSYHAIAPNFIAFRMFTGEGERCLLHTARAIGATESAHYWIEGGLEPGFDEAMLAQAIEYEWRVYREDMPIIRRDRAPRAAARAQCGLQHPRRPVHARLPAGVLRVRRAHARGALLAGGHARPLSAASYPP